MKRRVSFYLRITISLILIGWLLLLADRAEIAATLADADFAFLGLAILVVNLDGMFMAYKWNILLTSKEIRLPLLHLIAVYYRARVLSKLMPAVGADAVRIFEVSRVTKKPADVLSSVILERLGGIVAVILVGLLGLGLFAYTIDKDWWNVFLEVFVFFAFVTLIFVISFGGRWTGALHKWLSASKLGFMVKLSEVLKSYEAYSNHKRALLLFLFLTVLEQFASVFVFFLIASALHLEIPLATFLIFVPITMAAIRLPISLTFDGFGVREGMLVYLFGLVGVPQGQAFLLGFLEPVLGWFAFTPFLVYSVLTNKLTFKTTAITLLTPREQ